MAGFVSSPPPAVPDPEEPALDLVAGDDFYPGVSIADARASLRLGEIVTDIRIRDALRAGMVTIRRELRSWKAGHVAAGTFRLVDVADETIDGESAAELIYRRAVFAYAAADLAETHHDISATAAGKDRAEERVLSADEFRRNGIHAVRDIKGLTRTAVELI